MVQKRTIEETGATATEVEAAQVSGYRRVLNAKGKMEQRPVVATLKECLDGMGDFYHPQINCWLRPRGVKECDKHFEGGVWIETEGDLYEPSEIEKARLEKETLEDRQRAKLLESLLERENY